MKPILFNTEMVRAILDGRKTVTRRAVKFPEGMTGRLPSDGSRNILFYPGGIKHPPYTPGDILYVRETWFEYAGQYVYKATAAQPELWNGMWKPSIHMPKEAARIFLRVKSVHPERLQSITRNGAISEGCNAAVPIVEFSILWDSTVKPAARERWGWKANPWVWVIEFERYERPVEVSIND